MHKTKMRAKGPVAMAANQNLGKHAMDTMHEHMDELRGRMKRRTEEGTDVNRWMEWKGERMNGRMESMFDSGMDGCLGEKRRTESILGGFFGGLSERTKKNLKKLEKVRKSKKKLEKVSLHLSKRFKKFKKVKQKLDRS